MYWCTTPVAASYILLHQKATAHTILKFWQDLTLLAEISLKMQVNFFRPPDPPAAPTPRGPYVALAQKTLPEAPKFLFEYSLGTAQILSNISSLFDRFHRLHSRNKYENIPMLPRSHRKHNAPLSPDTAAPQQYCTDHHGGSTAHPLGSRKGDAQAAPLHAPFIAAESRSKPMELLIETRYLVSTICDISAACCNAVMWFLLVTRAANRCTSSEIGCAHSCHQAKEVAHARRRK